LKRKLATSAALPLLAALNTADIPKEINVRNLTSERIQRCPIPILPPPLAFKNAEGYELLRGRWSRRLAPLLIRFGGLSDGDRVLDVGCGTGSLTFTLPEIANVAGMVGIDLTEPYVDFAHARKTDPRITFQQADARALPFEDTFSIAPSPCSYCNLSRMRHARWPRCVVWCALVAR
jgi:SAM-dependent methyltransferase